jgi:hypothetical protein
MSMMPKTYKKYLLIAATIGSTLNAYAIQPLQPGYGVEKKTMDPIPVDVENLEDVTSEIASGILSGFTYTVDSSTNQNQLASILYPELSNALSAGITGIISSMGNPLNIASSIATQTGTPINSPYSSSSAVQFNLTDMTQHVYDCITKPITTSINNVLTTPGNAIQSIFPNQNNQYAMYTAKTNINNCQNADSQSSTYNSSNTEEAAKININDIINNSDVENLAGTSSWASYLILNQLTAAALKSCAVSLDIQSSSSSSSSSGSAPDPNVGNHGTIAAKTTVKCQIPQAACMITNTVNNILSAELNKAENYTLPQGYEKLKDAYPVIYNNLVKYTTSQSVQNLKGYYNQNISYTECLNAQSSNYPAPDTANAQSDLNLTADILMLVNKEINKIIKKQIASSIIKKIGQNTQSGSYSTNNDEIPQLYTLTASSDINTLLGYDSLIGKPSSETVCTIKQPPNQNQNIQDKRLAIITSTLVDNLTQTSQVPNPITPQIPFDSEIGAVGGGFGLLSNTDIMDASTWSTIDSNRNSSTQTLKTQADQFKTQFLGFSANNSIPVGILNEMQSSRQNSIQIPVFTDSSGTIMNPASGTSKPGYIPAGESCTSQEIDHFTATYRLKGIPSGDKSVKINNWQQAINDEKNIGILHKEEVLLLAEIRYQLYQEQKQLEQELAAESISLMQTLSKNIGELTSIHSDMMNTIDTYITGGGKTNTNNNQSN